MKTIEELEKDYVKGLTPEEIEILQDLEAGHYVPVENQEEEKERLKQIFLKELEVEQREDEKIDYIDVENQEEEKERLKLYVKNSKKYKK